MAQCYKSVVRCAIGDPLASRRTPSTFSFNLYQGVVVPTSRKSLCLPLLFLAACAGGPATQASTDAGAATTVAPATSRNTNLLTRDDLADPTFAGSDLLQVVRRLRPQYLTTRGTVSKSNAAAGAVQVSIDGGALQALSSLSAMRVEEVQEVRYYTVSEAAQKFGSMAASGPVITVKRK